MPDRIVAMDFGSRAKRWFGAAEMPLRRAVVQGIDDASSAGNSAGTLAGTDDDIENPFDVDSGLMQQWLPGTATIVSVSRTGEWVDRNEFFEVTLEIELEGIEVYEIRQRQLIPERSQFEWQPGIEVRVLVNPADLSKAVLT